MWRGASNKKKKYTGFEKWEKSGEREKERRGDDEMEWGEGERGSEGERRDGKRETLMQFILITRYFAA